MKTILFSFTIGIITILYSCNSNPRSLEMIALHQAIDTLLNKQDTVLIKLNHDVKIYKRIKNEIHIKGILLNNNFH